MLPMVMGVKADGDDSLISTDSESRPKETKPSKNIKFTTKTKATTTAAVRGRRKRRLITTTETEASETATEETYNEEEIEGDRRDVKDDIKKDEQNDDSRYRGVYWCKTHRNYRVRVKFNNVRYHIGYYKDKVEAAMAYDREALRIAGEYARLNFPDINQQQHQEMKKKNQKVKEDDVDRSGKRMISSSKREEIIPIQLQGREKKPRKRRGGVDKNEKEESIIQKENNQEADAIESENNDQGEKVNYNKREELQKSQNMHALIPIQHQSTLFQDAANVSGFTSSLILNHSNHQPGNIHPHSQLPIMFQHTQYPTRTNTLVHDQLIHANLFPNNNSFQTMPPFIISSSTPPYPHNSNLSYGNQSQFINNMLPYSVIPMLNHQMQMNQNPSITKMSNAALNIVMKLMAVLSLVFADFFLSINNGDGVIHWKQE